LGTCGLTATLLVDLKVENAIFSLLGVNRGEFHLIRRSNARYDIQILFRPLYSGIEGKLFPEIAWVLGTTDKTLIFGNTVPLVFPLKSYLQLFSKLMRPITFFFCVPKKESQLT
jgi:hypothetical protein